jgi:hypothetical protein
MARKPKGGEDQTWWSDPVEVPRADLPSAKKLRNRTKWYRRVVFSTVIMMPIVLLALFVALAGGGGEDAPTVSGRPPATQADAILAVKKWMAQTPSPLPNGEVISWDSYRKAKLPTGREALSDVDRLEVHTLTLTGGNGLLFHTQVQLAFGKSTGAVIVGEPSLVPLAPGAAAGSADSVSPWPTLEGSTATEGAETAIKAWAEAFTSGDPALLLNAVGDSRNGVSYVPLSGVTFSKEPTIGDVGALWGKDQSRNDPGAVPERMVVTVQFEGQWNGTEVGLSQQLPVFTYDLLIDRANTATPKVVAWGGQGSGVWLKPYSNAISGRVVAAPDAPETPDEAVEPGATAPEDTAPETPTEDAEMGGI